jgi:Fe-S cluster assembly ATP-binding protein
MLVVENLHVEVSGQKILKGLNLTVKKGEIHAIMGPNGSGKSTLSKVVSGHPDYEITQGRVLFQGQDIIKKDPTERALMGIFMGFQYPVEIPGVNNEAFLKMSYNAQRKYAGLPEASPAEFEALLKEKMALVEADEKFRKRNLNVGMSGGEKKKNEILQLAILNPKLAILDETDSGLDIDALRIVASGVKKVIGPEQSLILITHYQRLLSYIEPHFVHVLSDGVIIKSGDKSLALELEAQGYDWLIK